MRRRAGVQELTGSAAFSDGRSRARTGVHAGSPRCAVNSAQREMIWEEGMAVVGYLYGIRS
jgi:hypothetical protein